FANALAEDCGALLNDEGRRHVDRVLASAGRMGELIDGMLELARVVKAPLRRVEIDLSQLAKDVVNEIAATAPTRSVEIAIHPGMQAAGDPSLLRAAMTNLIGNAWKYTSKRTDGRIEVGHGGEDGGHPVFFVRDNGAGFDMAYANKLFGV